MSDSHQSLIIELTAKIEKYNSDMRMAGNVTDAFQERAVKSFNAVSTASMKSFKVMSSTITALKKDVDGFERTLDKLNRLVNSNGKEVKKSDAEYTKLKGTIKDLKLKMKELNTTNRDSKSITKELNSRFSALNTELRAYKSVVNANKKETETFNAAIAKLSRDIEKMTRKTDGLETELRQLKTETESTSASMFKFSNVAKGVLAALSVREVLAFSDSVSKANSQLRSVTTSTEQYNLVQLELNRIALETRQNVNELTGVYARFSRAGQEAGFTQHQVLELTENLTKAFKIEGNTTAEVNSTLLQLTQSFRSGVIQGEEFRAVSESSTLVLQALSKQLGVSTGDLKKLASEGGITPQDLISGLAKLDDEITQQFKTVAPTFAEVGAQMGNTFAIAFRESGVSQLADDLTTALNNTFKTISRSIEGKEIISLEALTNNLKIVTEEAKKLKAELASGDLGFIDQFTKGSQLDSFTARAKELEERIKSLKKEISTSETKEKEKPKALVKLGIGAKEIIKQGLERLGIMDSQAKKELQLIQDVADKKITQAEANAKKAFERESDQQGKRLSMILKRAKISSESIEEIRSKAAAEGVDSLNDDERAVFDLIGEFAEKQINLAKNLQVELGVIQGDANDKKLEKEKAHQDKMAEAKAKKAERDKGTISKEKSRLDTIREEADLELELLQEIAEEKISQQEANAIASNEAENARNLEKFEATLERLGTNKELLDELEFANMQGEIEKLTDHESQLLAIKQSFADSELVLRTAQDKKIDKIREKERKRKSKVEELSEKNREELIINSGLKLLNIMGKNSKTMATISDVAAKANIVRTTSEAAMLALKNGGGAPWGLIPMTATIAQGAAQFAAVGSGSIASGSGGSGGVVGPDISSITDDTPEVSSTTSQQVDVSVIGEDNTSSTSRTEITFNSDSGGAAEAAMGELLNDMSRRGALNMRRS